MDKEDAFENTVTVSIVIPSLDGSREGNVPKLLEDIEKQTIKNKEVHLIKGIKPSGLARNIGARQSEGEVLIFLDDDIRLGNEKVFLNLIKPLFEDEKIGITGASIRIPENANRFQRRCAREIPRLHFPIVQEITQSDMVTTACCAVRRSIFQKVGGFDPNIPRGVDPEFRAKVREKGYKVVLVPNTWFYHPAPANIIELTKMSFRNGWASAYLRVNYPELIYEVPPTGESEFEQKATFSRRISRNLLATLGAIFTGKPLLFWERICYLMGYLSRRVVNFAL